jgi:hypothetical protein
MAKWGWSVPSGTQRKKRQKLWKGEALPLDGSLLMGDFSTGQQGAALTSMIAQLNYG